MKKSYLPTSIIFISLLYLLIGNEKVNPREKYDKYLAGEYRQMSGLFTDETNDVKEPDHPEMAAFQNHYMIIDPETKKVPEKALLKSYNYTNRLKTSAKFNYRDDIDWNQVQSNMGGRIRGIMWDPVDTNKVWACSVTGGLWYNNNVEDENSNWNQVDGFWTGLSTNCITYDPNNQKVFYVGTGEYHTARTIYRESSGVGYGIWKTTDGGNTWNIIESTRDFKYISDIKVRNENGNSIIYAGVVSGIYKGKKHLSKPEEGLYRSDNNGQSWEQVLPDIQGDTLSFAPADIEIAANNRIFIGTLKNIEGNGGANILWSDTGLKGSWHVFNDYENIIKNDSEYPLPGRVIIGAAPSDSKVVYALVGAGWYNGYGFNYARGRYILKSVDGGLSWTEKSIPQNDPGWASLSWHAFDIAVNPGDPENVFVGGLDLWKSTNGGDNWAHASDWGAMYSGGGDDYVHADQHWIAYKPGSSKKAIFSTDGGVFYSSNADEISPVFEERNNNLSTLQFYSCEISPVKDLNLFIGGLQDNGSLLYLGQPLNINNMISGGDGAYCFIDQDEPQKVITSLYYNKYYLFENLSYKWSFGQYGTGVFINPGDYDSKNNILYTNACSFKGNLANNLLCVTISPDTSINTFVDLGTNLNTYFSHIKVSSFTDENQTTLFVGSQNGRLFKVTNPLTALQTFEIGSNDFPVANISSVAIGGSEDTLLVTFSNYGVKSVWETYDGGQNWTDISGNLPDMPVRWALYHHDNSSQVLLATELGIWYRESMDSNIWKPDNSFPNVRIDMLKIRENDNTVVVASHGMGLFWGKWEKESVRSEDIVENNDFEIYPNPSNGIFNIKGQKDSYYSVFDIKGRVILKGKINPAVSLDLSNQPKGIYYLKIRNKKRIFTEILVLQ